MLAQRQAQMQAQGGISNGVNQLQRNGSIGNPNLPSQNPNSGVQQGQNGAAMAARAQQNQQGIQTSFPNGNMPGMPLGTPGVPQAQMQGSMQNGQRMGPPDQMRMAMQRSQFPNVNQQHQYQLQQQQINMASNLTQGMGLNGIPNANMIASLSNQNMNGNVNGMNASINGLSGHAGSPRMNQVNSSMQTPARPVSSGHMSGILHLQNNIKQAHPDWSPDQVQKRAADQYQIILAKQQQRAALSAAAGAAGTSGLSPSQQIGNSQYIPPNPSMANSPPGNAVQNYQQQLVQQQQMMSRQTARQQAGSPGMSVRPPSRSATPQNAQMQQSPGMQQAQVNRS
jgi:chromatin modification-related protein VID21